MTAGVALWYALAAELNRATRNAIDGWRAATLAERCLWIYCGAFALAWLLPFDFTLRPDEIGDKYSHKRLLLPLAPSPDAATPLHLLTATVAAIPLGVAAILCGNGPRVRRSFPTAFAIAIIGLFGLTFLQVTVFSRTTDLTVMVVAFGGAIAGAGLALPRRSRRRRLQAETVHAAMIIAIWLIATAAIEWWPYLFDLDVGRARREVASWADAPFRAVPFAELMPCIALAAAAGAAIQPRLPTDYVRLQLLATMSLAAVALLWIEGIQLLLPGAAPTLLAVALETAAFASPMALAMLRPNTRVLPERA
jgi:glycopeptide antibiotics resistance protein